MKNKIYAIYYDDYNHDLYDLHEEKRKGFYEIKKLTIPKGTRDMFFNKKICQTEHFDDYHIIQLVKVKDSGALMTDTPFEVQTNQKAINKAKGDVLELGMGIGYFTFYASRKKNVKSITIVELRKGIIDLVYPTIGNKKTNVIHDDAMKFLKTTKRKFDMINIDFVAGMHPFENYDEIMKLAERLLNPKGVAVYWQEDIWKIARKFAPKKPIRSKGFSFHFPPCHTCGKNMRDDYAGFCSDCADIMGFVDYSKGKKLPLKKDGTIDNEKFLEESAIELGYEKINGRWVKNVRI